MSQPTIDELRERAGYYKRTRGGTDTFADGCHICGREVKPATARLVYETDNGTTTTPDDPNGRRFLVGPECAKKLTTYPLRKDKANDSND